MTLREWCQAAFAVYGHYMLSILAKPRNAVSLARTDNYRGKYPHIGPRPEWDKTGAVDDGELYPLTNKLDYVFFKRHMVRDATEGNSWTELPQEGIR